MAKKQLSKSSEGKDNEKDVSSDQPGKIPIELQNVLKNIPEPQRKELTSVLQYLSIKRSFAGPLPPPEILIGYNECVNNGAERIISMVEKQSTHRMHIEDHVVKEQLKQSGRGQNYGFAMGIVCIITAIILALTGHETVASIIGGTTIVGLVTVFVVGKKEQKKEKETDE